MTFNILWLQFVLQIMVCNDMTTGSCPNPLP